MSDCIFCSIAQKKSPAEVVYEDDDLIAFRDIAPKAPIHILIIPKRHLDSMNDLTPNDHLLAGALLVAARDLAVKLGIADPGYKLVINTGADGGQAVGHLHLHLLGGEPLRWHV